MTPRWEVVATLRTDARGRPVDHEQRVSCHYTRWGATRQARKMAWVDRKQLSRMNAALVAGGMAPMLHDFHVRRRT